MAYLSERRKGGRFEVRWPLLYTAEDIIGQGTILNVSSIGCQVAGNMPAAVGMTLKVWVWPSQRGEALCVEEARVLWVKAHEFGIEFVRLSHHEQQWLRGFLETAERRDSFKRIAAGMELAAMPVALPSKD